MEDNDAYNNIMQSGNTMSLERMAKNAMNNQSTNNEINHYSNSYDIKNEYHNLNEQNNQHPQNLQTNNYPDMKNINDLQRQEEIKLAIEEVRRRNEETERIKLIQRLQRIAGKETPDNIHTLDINHLRRLTVEYRSLRQSEVIVKLFRRMLVFSCRVIEYITNTVDNKHKMIDLRGWAESMQIEIDMYEEHFYDIYEYYLNSLSDNPIIILSMMIATNAAQHSMERKMYSMLHEAGATKEDFANVMSQMKEEEESLEFTHNVAGLVNTPGRTAQLHEVLKKKKNNRYHNNNNNKKKQLSSKSSVVREEKNNVINRDDDDEVSTISLHTTDLKNHM